MKRVFKFGGREIVSDGKTEIAGILNVTPDSFSDGGKFNNVEAALERAKLLVEEGATMLDIGGESTRPGSTPVDHKDEIDRVVPVIKALKKELDVPLSIDTWKADVARAALEAGADIINDITGLMGDPNMAQAVGETDAGIVAMFNPVLARPNHPSSEIFPKFGGEDAFSQEEFESMSKMDILDLMNFYFAKTIERAVAAGITRDRLALDPGIGFGLTKRENLILVKDIDVIHDLGFTAYLGVSRKRFIVNILEEAGFNLDPETEEGFENRDLGSMVLTAIAAEKGVEMVRVHTASVHKMAAAIADNVRLADEQEETNFKAYGS